MIKKNYKEFELLKKDFVEKEKSILLQLDRLNKQKQEILNSYFLYRVINFVKITDFYLAIFTGLIVYFILNLLGAIISFIIIYYLLRLFVSSRPKIEKMALNSSGSTWLHLDFHFKMANNKLIIINGEYKINYDKLCVNFISYPPDWNERRKIVLERDGYCCQQCFYPIGFKRRARQLQVHHIKALSEGGNNSIDNLVTLCHICHRGVDEKHSSVIKLDRKKMRKRF